MSSLTNAHYVDGSRSCIVNWAGGDRGRATAAASRACSVSTTLGGSATNDVGGYPVTALTNGNYVVRSPGWNGGMGAVTWGSGTAGVSGAVSDANSLVGSSANDQVGIGITLTCLMHGSVVILTRNCNRHPGAGAL